MASYAVHFAENAKVVVNATGVERYESRHNVLCGAGVFYVVLASQYPEHVDCRRCLTCKDFPESIDSEPTS